MSYLIATPALLVQVAKNEPQNGSGACLVHPEMCFQAHARTTPVD